jgi:pimeloyl-ACP methyl ester carboxylesterase
MGGPVSLLAAPLLEGRVAGIIGVDTLQDAEFLWPADEKERFLARWEADFDGSLERFVTAMFSEGAHAEIQAEVLRVARRVDPDTAIALSRSMLAYDARAALSASGVPVFCINAPNERFPTRVEVNRRYAPAYDAVMIEGVGHYPMLERPEELNAKLSAAVSCLREMGTSSYSGRCSVRF